MKQPPIGYVVVNEELWDANERLFSHGDLLDLADGGLLRVGLQRELKWREENGQESMAAMFGECDL